jgi:hypothetical protein
LSFSRSASFRSYNTTRRLKAGRRWLIRSPVRFMHRSGFAAKCRFRRTESRPGACCRPDTMSGSAWRHVYCRPRVHVNKKKEAHRVAPMRPV